MDGRHYAFIVYGGHLGMVNGPGYLGVGGILRFQLYAQCLYVLNVHRQVRRRHADLGYVDLLDNLFPVASG